MDQKKKDSIEEAITALKGSSDLIDYDEKAKFQNCRIVYMKTLADSTVIQNSILPSLKQEQWYTIVQLKEIIKVENMLITNDTDVIKEKILTGYIMISLCESALPCLLINANKTAARAISLPEVEFSVVGPKEAFVESMETNLNLIRKRIPIPEFQVKELEVGDLSKTKVAVLYIEGITNEENVKTITQRIKDIQFDQISDSSFISQMIADNHLSPFPQLLDTERPDRVASVLAEGKVAVIVDGSPHVLLGPTTLVEFFSAFEDYFLNWIISSFFRLVRVFAVTFSILATPVYVAVLTYHYELIPRELLNTLVASRQNIPIPPILEALFLELTIELLREAGARLPTKVGQTIGIVGGIVIGTASVEAGLTSNILLIIVALAALASFTTPVYVMGNTIRLLRFPFLLFAQWIGLLGIVYCFCILLTHLLRLTSLGRPFLEPIFPPRTADMKDAFIRLPFSLLSKRPLELQTNNPVRFSSSKAKKNKDIDE
ncbi:spore germination protein [Metabacillus fastidiosus]|uniref:spore germination protein n=1 Tax=Metabacillus fastidiosus TaxID=1458 RepID=UPI002DB83D6F|nr:spore germination protein [Metabacillus fastidiosus]MEC2077330.1 spore germination protein [Metabacillus fastidiosus]